MNSEQDSSTPADRRAGGATRQLPPLENLHADAREGPPVPGAGVPRPVAARRCRTLGRRTGPGGRGVSQARARTWALEGTRNGNRPLDAPLGTQPPSRHPPGPVRRGRGLPGQIYEARARPACTRRRPEVPWRAPASPNAHAMRLSRPSEHDCQRMCSWRPRGFLSGAIANTPQCVMQAFDVTGGDPLVGRDRLVGDIPAADEVVDGHVGAQVADELHMVQSEWLNRTESVESQNRQRQRVRRSRSGCPNAVPRPSGQARTSLDGGATCPSMRTSSPNDWSSLSLASEDDRK